MHRNTLKQYAPQARRDFIAAVTDRAAYYGLTRDTIAPITAQGDVVIITLEAQRVILEKCASSPVDASFGLWADLPPGPTYVDTLRDEWDTRLTERLSNG